MARIRVGFRLTQLHTEIFITPALSYEEESCCHLKCNTTYSILLSWIMYQVGIVIIYGRYENV